MFALGIFTDWVDIWPLTAHGLLDPQDFVVVRSDGIMMARPSAVPRSRWEIERRGLCCLSGMFSMSSVRKEGLSLIHI